MADATKPHDRVVFLDRDGVINQEPPDPGWVVRWEDLVFAEGALDALRRLREHGFTVVVVTNQSCVGRGLTTYDNIQAINDRVRQAIAAAGGEVTRLYCCPHTSEDGCACRKPRPGMIEQAARELGLRPERAFLVGDSERDVQAGAAVGCTTFLVDNYGRGRAELTQADYVVGGVAEAVERILAVVGEGAKTAGQGQEATGSDG